MSSNLKVNAILPSTGTNVAIGTAGGSITMVGNVDIDINSGISTFNDIHISDKIVHDGDTNTSIRFPAADTITAETGGSERLRIDSSGFIGMGGNTNPTNVLHIKTAVTNTAVATIESTATNSYPFLRLKNDAREYQLTCHGGLSDAFTIYDGTSTAHRFLIDSSGRVLIGKTSGDHILDINASSNEIRLTKENESNYTGIQLDRDASGNAGGYFGLAGNTNHYINGSAQHDIILRSESNLLFSSGGATERLRIASSGLITVNRDGVGGRIDATAGDSSIKISDGNGRSSIKVSDPGSGNSYEWELTSAGNFKAPNGKGIDFSATANSSGSMSSELLDDYEEGSWTASVVGGNTITTNAAYYTKIGRMVYWVLHCKPTFAQNNTTVYQIYGLPFTSANVTQNYGWSGNISYTDSGNSSVLANMRPLVQMGNTYIYFHTVGLGDGARIKNNFIRSTMLNQDFLLGGFYMAAS